MRYRPLYLAVLMILLAGCTRPEDVLDDPTKIFTAFDDPAATASAAAKRDATSAAKSDSGAPPSTQQTQTHLPRRYACVRTTKPIQIDGRGDDPAWASARWTDDFVDIEGDAKPRPRFGTRAKMLWDEQYLYVYAELEEPHVWGTLTQKNSVIYHDNDFEIFIDPDGDGLNYYEFEMNALNTIWELTLDKPYHAGGTARLGTNLVGLKSAVRVDGTINDPSDTDRKWSVEVALPWAGLAEYQPAALSPPSPGDAWRINFSRVQWRHEIKDGKYVKIPKEQSPEDNWVWSPTGVIDMHRPEKWGVVTFERAKPPARR